MEAVYHWLPPTDFFKGGFVNFRKLLSLSDEEFNGRFDAPSVQISPSFVKGMVARFSAYYARQGQPDIDFEQIIGGVYGNVADAKSPLEAGDEKSKMSPPRSK